MNNFKVNNKREDLKFEIEFTKAYKKAKQQYEHPAQLELACLKAQYPAILHPVQDEDLFAGRIDFGAVGLGIQHQTGGFGYFAHEDKIVDELENGTGSLKYREDLHDMLNYWRTEKTDVKMMAGMPEDISEALPSDLWIEIPSPAVPILRIAGTYLNFDKLVKLGIPGLKEEVSARLELAKKQNEDVILLESMMGALDLIVQVCEFYANQIRGSIGECKDSERTSELEVMACVLDNIQNNAPSTMREAIQLVWIYSLLTPEIEFGRMDVYLGDLYVKDLAEGIVTEEKALAYIQSYFRLIDHLDCETDGRVIVGGYGRRNPENADKLCEIAIEACRTVREVLPQFTLRFNKETPKHIWEAAMRCIEEGRTYPLLYNDDVLIPSIMKAYEVDRERAESYVPLGCGEIEFDHYSLGSPSGSLNLLKILEMAMHGGFDPVSKEHVGPKVKGLKDCDTFDEFYNEYKKVLDYYVEAQAKFEMYQYEKTGELHSFMYVTMLYDGCLEKAKPILAGGCESLNGTLELYGLINAADSLTSIKRLVFDDKSMTAERMLEVLKSNFFEYERERKMMIDVPKYGNDNNEADSMMVNLHEFICNDIRDKAELVGLDTNLAVIINNAQNTTLGRWVGASADGRKSGTAMANANNPSPGADKNGVTAMLNSILKPTHDIHAGAVQNIRFTRELFDSSREKVNQLVDSYFDRGGAQAMITVVGKDDLKNAMEHPENYQDLIVRVGGFSARFVNLQKDVQKEIYERVTY